MREERGKRREEERREEIGEDLAMQVRGVARRPVSVIAVGWRKAAG